tara:strand:- start:9 stop:383 length:375 start_codon:yes stop_codon:yes gene_type:complete
MTNAKVIALWFNDDGSNWYLDGNKLSGRTFLDLSCSNNTSAVWVLGQTAIRFHNTHLDEVCKAVNDFAYSKSNVETYHPEYGTGMWDQIWVFDDGSYIAESNGYWDVSEDDGTCWNGYRLVEVP